MISFILFIFILSLLIVIHEWGHFFAAKKEAVSVEFFSLGFGPIIFKKKIKETQFQICLIPFGGYVKMAGDNREEYQGRPDEYLSKTPGQRAKIIFFGPLFNYLLAILCFWIVCWIGYPYLSSKIGEIIDGFGAKEAGLISEDKIIAVDDKPVEFWDELQKIIYKKKENDTVKIKVLRGSDTLLFNVRIKEEEIPQILGGKKRVGLIGIRPAGEIIKKRYSLGKAIFWGSKRVLELTFLTYRAIFNMLLRKVSLKDSITGPLGMFYITQEATKFGLSALLHFIGILNISLTVFNLLPIPVLDGGHLLFLGIEKIKRKALSLRVEKFLTQAGLSIIIILALFIFYNDLVKFGIWEKLAQLIRR